MHDAPIEIDLAALPSTKPKTGRWIVTSLNDVLSLINCAEDYGHGGDVLFSAFRDWLGSLSNVEIESYAQTFLTPQARFDGYTEEDANDAVRRLTEWRNHYLPLPEPAPLFYGKLILHMWDGFPPKPDGYQAGAPSYFYRTQVDPAKHGAVRDWWVPQTVGDQIWVYAAFSAEAQRDAWIELAKAQIAAQLRPFQGCAEVASKAVIPDPDDVDYWCRGKGYSL